VHTARDLLAGPLQRLHPCDVLSIGLLLLLCLLGVGRSLGLPQGGILRLGRREVELGRRRLRFRLPILRLSTVVIIAEAEGIEEVVCCASAALDVDLRRVELVHTARDLLAGPLQRLHPCDVLSIGLLLLLCLLGVGRSLGLPQGGILRLGRREVELGRRRLHLHRLRRRGWRGCGLLLLLLWGRGLEPLSLLDELLAQLGKP